MKESLTLAYSPCPNDTFLFYHLVHENISGLLQIKEELRDVEELNQSASIGKYDITKLSFAAMFGVLDQYELLNCGAALGRGCGPLLVKKKGKQLGGLSSLKIAVPGLKTTANLLLSLYTKGKNISIPMRYDLIMDEVLNENYDVGLVIHEERFTYEKRGLEKVVDLGEWWEADTGLPIPLGAIAIKRSLPADLKLEVQNALRKSLELAWALPEKTKNYILQHSQNKDLEVVEAHINLYVNDFTKDLGADGKRAVEALYERGLESGFLKERSEKSLFLD